MRKGIFCYIISSAIMVSIMLKHWLKAYNFIRAVFSAIIVCSSPLVYHSFGPRAPLFHDISLLVEKFSFVNAVCWLHFSCHLLGRLHGLHSVLRLDQNSILWLSFLIVIDFSTIYSERLRFLWNIFVTWKSVHSFHLFFLSHGRLFKNNSEVYLTVIVKILIRLWFDRIIGIIIKEIESNIAKNTFLVNFRMGSLPTLCKKFVELVVILVSHLQKSN